MINADSSDDQKREYLKSGLESFRPTGFFPDELVDSLIQVVENFYPESS